MQHLKNRRIATLCRRVFAPTYQPVRFGQELAAENQIHCLLQKAGETTEVVYFDPLMSFQIDDHVLKIISGQNDEHLSIAKPLDDLKSMLESYSTESSSGECSNELGYIGYIGYDCIRYLEAIALPEVKSSEPEAFVFVYGSAIAYDHLTQSAQITVGLFRISFESQSETYKRLQTKLDLLCDKILKTTSNALFASGNPEEIEPKALSSVFQKNFDAIQTHINEGDVFQCVVSERFDQPQARSVFETYETLKSQNPSPYNFYLFTPKFSLVGASPEPFVKVTEGVVSTFPIAGTRPRGNNPVLDEELSMDLLNDPKETAEHTMLVDLARNDLGKVSCPGTVNVNTLMCIQRFSQVMHLVSHVSGVLRPDTTPLQAFFSCFPAGTLTGAPKIRAMQIISEVESIRRGAYGGSFIHSVFNGDFDSFILIRFAVVTEQGAHVQAGAGIVADSTAHNEFLEIHLKSLSMRKALQPAQNSKEKSYDLTH